MPFAAAIPLITAGAGLLGKIFGAGAQGAANQRQADNSQTAQQNALLASLYNTRQSAATNAYNTRQGATTNALNAEEAGKLNRAQLGLTAPTMRAKQSILGSMMENMQPVTATNTNPRLAGRIPTINGGLTPAMLSDTTRAHGKELQRAAMEAQFSGSDIPAATNFQSGILDPTLLESPLLQAPKGAGTLEKVLGGGGLLGSILGSIGELMEERPRSGHNLPIDPYGGG